MKSSQFLKTVSLTSLSLICCLLILMRATQNNKHSINISGYGIFVIIFIIILVVYSDSLFGNSNCSIDTFDNILEKFNEIENEASIDQEYIIPTDNINNSSNIPMPISDSNNTLSTPNTDNLLSSNTMNMNTMNTNMDTMNTNMNTMNTNFTTTPIIQNIQEVNNLTLPATQNNNLTLPATQNNNLTLPTKQNNNLTLPISSNNTNLTLPISPDNNNLTLPINKTNTKLTSTVTQNNTNLSLPVTQKTMKQNVMEEEDIGMRPVTTEEIRTMVKEIIKESSKSYLEKEEYKEKDPLYYMNTGDLIDNSWENQFSVLNTKYWKPYFYDAKPPVCVGDNKYNATPTVMHTPYLELKNFSETTIKPAKLVNNNSTLSSSTQTNKPINV